jgi:hypothetical protein
MTAAKQIDSFLAKYSSEIAAQARACLKIMRMRLPHSFEMVYDNYNALVFAFSTSPKPADFLFSIALYPKWVTLFFAYGKGLPDPEKRLEGSGVRIRGIRLESAATLNDPAVVALMDAAIARSKVPFDAAHKHSLVVQSVSAKQRPRR